MMSNTLHCITYTQNHSAKYQINTTFFLLATGRLGIPTHKVSENTELKLIKENLNKSRLLEDQARLNDAKTEQLQRELIVEQKINKDSKTR